MELDDARLCVRHNQMARGRPALLMVHGLGETSACFEEAFQHELADRVNLIAPDLAGYGRSSASSDYSFDAHVRRLWLVLAEMRRQHGFALDRVFVLGHSMGGDIASLFCRSDTVGVVAGFINVEGDLTPADLFISSAAIQAENTGRFDAWFEQDFRDRLVFREWGARYGSCRRYYEALQCARRDAFLANAHELLRRNAPPGDPSRSEIGELYRALTIPKFYCYGEESVSTETREFLARNGLHIRPFPNAFHWVMVDAAESFWPFVAGFLNTPR